MDRTRIVFVAIIVIAAAIVGVSLMIRAAQWAINPAGEARTPLPENAIVVDVQSSNTKEDWMNQVVASFNEGGHSLNGKPIVVTVAHVGSGTSLEEVLQGKVKPVVWSPGSDFWVDRLNQAWQDRTGQRIILNECPATLRVPLVIAMWRPMAEALGWPEKPIGWDDLAALSTDPHGWSEYGHPEWGQFKFGHPHPEHSNSGMLALIAEVYSALNITDGLTVENVKSQIVIEEVGAVEQQVFHYGMKDTDLLGKMTQRGPSYLHAVISYEANVIKWNRDHESELRFPLVAIYPADGTFWVENSYCVLEGADWVSQEQVKAALIFRDYLLSPEQQGLAIDWGLRPEDAAVPLHSPIDLEHGAVPSITMSDVPHLAYPSDEIISHIIDMWHQVKKKATVILLLDTSGSMQGQKIKSAVQGAVTFIDQMHPEDELYVITFSSKVTELSFSGRKGNIGEPLKNALLGLYGEGGTALHEAVMHSVDRIEQLIAEDEEAGEKRLYGIVLLSDGKNEIVGGPSKSDMLSRLPSGTEASGIKIYAIAYGDDADIDLLKTLANRTNGKQFSGSVEDIEAVYFLISSEF